MKVAIITRSNNSSPKVLALSLRGMLNDIGADASIYYNKDSLERLQLWDNSFSSVGLFLLKSFYLVKYFFHDCLFFWRIRSYDAIIISECIPNAYWKNYLAIERLRRIVKSPILLYEVYFLENTPTQIEALIKKNDPLIERYDWHLSVSYVTEIKVEEKEPWTCIGIDLEKTGLVPVKKDKFIALVDFLQNGYEHVRILQLEVLQELGIDFIQLDKRYEVEELRDIYRKASVFFMQFPEAFGVPIAECLATGCSILTPNSAWPMSWRLNEDPEIHKSGILGPVFTIYQSKDHLKQILIKMLREYDPIQTPQKVFNEFTKDYHHYYYGNKVALKKTLDNLIKVKG